MSNGITSNTTVAPILKPFNNIITSGICTVIVVLGTIGLVLLVSGQFKGVAIATLAVIIFVLGFTDIPTKPRTAGVLTFWGSFITLGGKPVIVGGKTILADYFPFYLGCVQFDITNVDKKIKMSVTSKDNIVMHGEVSVTLFPDIDDAVNYIQAGSDAGKIVDQLDDIVKKKAREIAMNNDALDITQQSGIIFHDLSDHVRDNLEGKAFGVRVLKVQAIFDQPADLVVAMKGKKIEQYQRANEMFEYETNQKAAQALQDAYKADPSMSGHVPSLDQCLEKILEQRLIRDGRAQEIRSKGGRVINIIRPNSTP